MALAAWPIVCQLNSDKPGGQRDEPGVQLLPVQKVRLTVDNGKIFLQPRVCTLRSYGSDGGRVMRTKSDEVSQFFEKLSEYIESSKKSQDFEIISGRLAMIVFAGTVTMEVVTGNSLFGKMDLQGIVEAAGVCLGAIACAAAFACLSSARNRVDRIFSISYNTFIDSLIDQVIDGLFYESDLTDWSDEL